MRRRPQSASRGEGRVNPRIQRRVGLDLQGLMVEGEGNDGNIGRSHVESERAQRRREPEMVLASRRRMGQLTRVHFSAGRPGRFALRAVEDRRGNCGGRQCRLGTRHPLQPRHCLAGVLGCIVRSAEMANLSDFGLGALPGSSVIGSSIRQSGNRSRRSGEAGRVPV